MWKKEIGSAFSEIIVLEDIICTMTSETTDSVTGSEFLIAFDKKNGDEIWKTKVDSIFFDVDGWGDGPKSTPTYDEDNIYCFSGFSKLTAISKKTGKIIWVVDFVAEFGSSVPRWGASTSPILVDNILIMEVGGTESRGFAAFNKKNGEVIWMKGNGFTTYSSPAITEIDGETQILFTNGSNLHSYNTKGDSLWTFQMPIRNPNSHPVFIEPNKIFISALGSVGFVIVEIIDNKPTQLLQGSTMKNDYSSSVYRDGYIYGFNIATLQCISAETGEKVWTKRGFGKGSFILVNDKLVVLSDQGKLILVEASPDGYSERGSFQAIEGKCWTAPSFADGKVYVRNLTEMACYKIIKN